MFDALSYRSWLKTLAAYMPSPCLVKICLESYLGLELNSCLAMLRPVESGDFMSPAR
jgi:hypothetical protein